MALIQKRSDFLVLLLLISFTVNADEKLLVLNSINDGVSQYNYSRIFKRIETNLVSKGIDPIYTQGPLAALDTIDRCIAPIERLDEAIAKGRDFYYSSDLDNAENSFSQANQVLKTVLIDCDRSDQILNLLLYSGLVAYMRNDYQAYSRYLFSVFAGDPQFTPDEATMTPKVTKLIDNLKAEFALSIGQHLTIFTDIPDAQVFFFGRSIGSTDEKGMIEVGSVAKGGIFIIIRKKGYKTAFTFKEVSVGDQKIRIELQPYQLERKLEPENDFDPIRVKFFNLTATSHSARLILLLKISFARNRYLIKGQLYDATRNHLTKAFHSDLGLTLRQIEAPTDAFSEFLLKQISDER